MSTYLEGLRSRLWSTGVAVLIFKLGPVDTPMTVDHPKHALFATPDGVARTLVRALDRRAAGTHYVPWFWYPILTLVRALPEWLFQQFPFLAGR